MYTGSVLRFRGLGFKAWGLRVEASFEGSIKAYIGARDIVQDLGLAVSV